MRTFNAWHVYRRHVLLHEKRDLRPAAYGGVVLQRFEICKGLHAILFPELRSPWPAVGKRELWEHPFQACAIACHRCRLRLRSEPDNLPLLCQNGCSQSSRFPTAGQGERSSGTRLVCMKKNGSRHYSWNFDISATKKCLPLCLVIFSIVKSPLSSIRSLLSELSLFGLPLLRKSKCYTLDSGLTPAQSENKKHWNPANRPNSSAESFYRVTRSFSVKFQATFVSTAYAIELWIEES